MRGFDRIVRLVAGELYDPVGSVPVRAQVAGRLRRGHSAHRDGPLVRARQADYIAGGGHAYRGASVDYSVFRFAGELDVPAGPRFGQRSVSVRFDYQVAHTRIVVFHVRGPPVVLKGIAAVRLVVAEDRSRSEQRVPDSLRGGLVVAVSLDDQRIEPECDVERIERKHALVHRVDVKGIVGQRRRSAGSFVTFQAGREQGGAPCHQEQ